MKLVTNIFKSEGLHEKHLVVVVLVVVVVVVVVVVALVEVRY